MITSLTKNLIIIRQNRRSVTIMPESFLTHPRSADFVISSHKLEFWDSPFSKEKIQPDEKDALFTELESELSKKGFTLEIQE